MSRGFVKEDDQEEAPIIPPRAALPEGVVNYVTPCGLEQLLEERISLENEIANLQTTDERERRRTLAVLNGKLNLLQERIGSARVLNPKDQPEDEVRFGATVNYTLGENQKPFQFKITGVDEADVKAQKIAFTAPIARAVTGKRRGEKIDFKMGGETRKLTIISIAYQTD